mgnify:FL=1
MVLVATLVKFTVSSSGLAISVSVVVAFSVVFSSVLVEFGEIGLGVVVAISSASSSIGSLVLISLVLISESNVSTEIASPVEISTTEVGSGVSVSVMVAISSA